MKVFKSDAFVNRNSTRISLQCTEFTEHNKYTVYIK